MAPQKITVKAVTASRKRVAIKPQYTRTATAKVTSARIIVTQGGTVRAKNVKSYRAAAGTYRVTQVIKYRSAKRARVTSAGKVKVLAWGSKVRVARRIQTVKVTRTAAPAVQVPPRISGTAQPGMPLAVQAGTWSGNPTKLMYEWLRDGRLIKGSPYRSGHYVPGYTDLGHRLSVRVTASGPGGRTAVRTSEVTVIAPKAVVQACPSTTFTDFHAGGEFALVTTPNGTVCGWGENAVGQLGTTTADYRAEATKVQVPASVAVAAGGHHGLALTAQGDVYAWGSNDSGQLGIEDPSLLKAKAKDERQAHAPDVPLSFAPRKVTGLPPVAAIEAVQDTSVAVGRDGHVYVWGSSYVVSGTELSAGRQPVPRRLDGLSGIGKVVSDGQRFLALSTDGSLLQWGVWPSGFLDGEDGTPSDDGGEVMFEETPSTRAVRKLADQVVSDIAMNSDSAYALTATGHVFGWGSGGGAGRSLPMVAWPGTSLVREPVEFTALPPASFLRAGGSSAAALLADGSIAYWGDGVSPESFTNFTSTPIPGGLTPEQPILRITGPSLSPHAIDFGGGWGGALTSSGTYTHLFSEGLNEYDGFPFRTKEHSRGKVTFDSLEIMEANRKGCSNSYTYDMSSDIPVLLTGFAEYDHAGMADEPYTSLEPWGVQPNTSHGGANVDCEGTLKVTLTLTTTSAWTWAPDGKRWTRTATRRWK